MLKCWLLMDVLFFWLLECSRIRMTAVDESQPQHQGAFRNYPEQLLGEILNTPVTLKKISEIIWEKKSNFPLQVSSDLSRRNFVSVFPVILQLGVGLVVDLTNLTDVHRVRGGRAGGGVAWKYFDYKKYLGNWKYFDFLTRVQLEGADIKVTAQHVLSEGKSVGWSPVIAQVSVALVCLPTHLRTMIKGSV